MSYYLCYIKYKIIEINMKYKINKKIGYSNKRESHFNHPLKLKLCRVLHEITGHHSVA